LYVNLPRYRKFVEVPNAHRAIMPTKFKASEPKVKVVRQWRAKVGSTNTVNMSNNISNAKARKEDWKGQIIIIAPLRLPWLEESWVGVTVEYMSMEFIREELIQEGLGCIRARYLGDKQVLLTGLEGAKLLEIIEGNRETLGKIFEVIKPWNECNKVEYKVVWASCRGVPLSLWTVD